jgi:NAD(P)-dependent dehydrogenase (short-subunit alcohol dehydrogenase family)
MSDAQKSALISGGASGLGAATARRLAQAGFRIVIFDRNADAGAALAAELGNGARAFAGDVTDPVAVQAAVDEAATAPLGLRVVVNCAGIGISEKTVGKTGAHDLDSFIRVINVNLIGTFNVMRLGAAAMNANEPLEDGERGVVVNTASVAAYEPQMGQVAYGASKGGIVTMTLAAARDLAGRGIRVVTIAPGTFDTPLLGSLPEEVRQSIAATIPFPSRLGDPAEYGALVEFIVANRLLNGETIRLDGGIRMAPK